MAGHAQEIAAALQAHLGFRVGAIHVWKTDPVRPFDDVFELLAAAADRDRLDLRFRQQSGPHEVTLSVYTPGKLKGDETELRITSASRITFGPYFDAIAGQDSYRVSLEGKQGESIGRGSESALRLEVSPFA